jgi:hypothetical protein
MIRYRIRSFWARTREASVREKVVWKIGYKSSNDNYFRTFSFSQELNSLFKGLLFQFQVIYFGY